LSINDTADNNELHGVKIRKPKAILEEMNTLKPSKKTLYDVDVNLMSTDELSKISLQMPSRDLQLKYADEMNAKRKVETVIPAALQNPDNLLIGHAEYRDVNLPVGLEANKKD